MADRGRRAGTYGSRAGEPALDELAAQSAELAKRWAIALIETAGPDGFAGVDLASISGDGAAMIEGLLEAAARDAEPPAQHTALAALAGAGSAAELARAVEALRSVLWEAALECSPRARAEPRAARRLTELGDRIAKACAELLAAELERTAPADTEPAREPPRSSAAPASAPTRIVIVDERSAEERPRAARAGESDADEEPVAGGRVADEPQHGGLIAARDARRLGPVAWIGAIGAQLEHFAHDGRPFAVMLVELLEAAVAEPAEDPKLALERTLETRLADWRSLTLTRERPGRYWVVAPASDRARAELLRERLEAALAGEPPGGAPYERAQAGTAAVAIGVAVCPDDGADAAGLAAQADLDLYAARSQARAAGALSGTPHGGGQAGRRGARP
jgi:hypothetical protein